MARAAEKTDVLAIMPLLIAMHGESSFADLTLDLTLVRQSLERWIDSPECCVFIAERDGEVVGIMAGCASEPWFTTDKVGYDFIFYLAPAVRGSVTGMRLFVMWSDFCIAQGVKQLRPAVSTGNDCGKFFERLGFVPQGSTYLMGV